MPIIDNLYFENTPAPTDGKTLLCYQKEAHGQELAEMEKRIADNVLSRIAFDADLSGLLAGIREVRAELQKLENMCKGVKVK